MDKIYNKLVQNIIKGGSGRPPMLSLKPIVQTQKFGDMCSKIDDDKNITYYFEYIRELGRGGSGTVNLARPNANALAIKAFPEFVAIKTIHTSRMTEQMIESLKNEIRFLMSFSSPIKIEYYHCFEETIGILYIVTEYVEGEDMLTHINNKTLPLLNRFYLAANLAVAIKTLHEHNIVHRDIKPNNVIVLPDKFNIKIIDFGISCDPTVVAGTCDDIAGTQKYLDPFINDFFDNDIDDATGLPTETKKILLSDWWAYGVTLYNLIFGIEIFDSSSVSYLKPEEILIKLKDIYGFDNLEVNKILVLLLRLNNPTIDPSMRPTQQEIIETLRNIISSVHPPE